jgi:hypothetical protein
MNTDCIKNVQNHLANVAIHDAIEMQLVLFGSDFVII